MVLWKGVGAVHCVGDVLSLCDLIVSIPSASCVSPSSDMPTLPLLGRRGQQGINISVQTKKKNWCKTQCTHLFPSLFACQLVIFHCTVIVNHQLFSCFSLSFVHVLGNDEFKWPHLTVIFSLSVCVCVCFFFMCFVFYLIHD